MAATRRSGCVPSARKGSVTSASRKRGPESSALAAPLAAARCRTDGTGGTDSATVPIDTTIGGWPLIHACAGIDPVTLRPRIARGVVAIGNIAVGIVAIGGVACGLFTLGGASIGCLLAIGGAALGLGVSVGGFAVGIVRDRRRRSGLRLRIRRRSLRTGGDRRRPLRRGGTRLRASMARYGSAQLPMIERGHNFHPALERFSFPCSAKASAERTPLA